MKTRTAIILLSFLLEVLLVPLIIWKVPYTEIDWKAYMQEVEGFINGERNYMNLKGDTGPLVYPAGFVYIYSVLYYITSQGANILLAQNIFAVLYLVFMAVILSIYKEVKDIPAWPIVLLCLSRRVHSIFVLRLFNDGIAMLLLYVAILFFLRNRWSTGCLMYSLAVSVKMNILLFAPGLFFLLLQRFGIIGTIQKLCICATVQLVLGIPFLISYPVEYLSRAFELSRVFFHIWTVNLKFLPEDIFQSKALAITLLICHLGGIFLFAHRRWCRHSGGLVGVFTAAPQNLTVNHMLSTLFESNFIGIVFARTLHFQFYVWYYHSLVYFLWIGCNGIDIWSQRCSRFVPSAKGAEVLAWLAGNGLRLAILGGIELVWNIFPSRADTSLALTILHLALLGMLFLSNPEGKAISPTPHDTQKQQKQQPALGVKATADRSKKRID